MKVMNLTQRIEAIKADPLLTPITKGELIEVLRNSDDKPKFLALTSVTKRDDLKKYDNYFIEVNGAKKKNPNAILNPFVDDGIINFSRKSNLITGFDYDNAINARMQREGIEQPFEGGESWHVTINKILSVHKNDPTKFYLRYQFLDNSIREIEYFYKNEPIAYQLFQSFIKKVDHYKNQKDQGLQNTLNIQVVNLDNIIAISIDKNKYKIV